MPLKISEIWRRHEKGDGTPVYQMQYSIDTLRELLIAPFIKTSVTYRLSWLPYLSMPIRLHRQVGGRCNWLQFHRRIITVRSVQRRLLYIRRNRCIPLIMLIRACCIYLCARETQIGRLKTAFSGSFTVIWTSADETLNGLSRSRRGGIIVSQLVMNQWWEYDAVCVGGADVTRGHANDG